MHGQQNIKKKKTKKKTKINTFKSNLLLRYSLRLDVMQRILVIIY